MDDFMREIAEKFYKEGFQGAENGDCLSMWKWASCIFEGTFDFPIDVKKGLNQLEIWYNSSNDKVKACACNVLAKIYFEGRYGKSIDYDKSFMYNELAEKLGNEGEPYLFGVSYLYGYGTEKNLEKARHYILLSAKQGDQPAITLKNQMGW